MSSSFVRLTLLKTFSNLDRKSQSTFALLILSLVYIPGAQVWTRITTVTDFYLSFYKRATVKFDWDRLHKACMLCFVNRTYFYIYIILKRECMMPQ